MERQTPVFVKIDEYKDVLDILDLVKNKLKDAKETINSINDLKNQEDAELEIWYREMHDIEKRIEYIDHALLEPENM